MTDKEKREFFLRHNLELELTRRFKDLSPKAIKGLVREAMESLAAREHILSDNEPAMGEIVDQAVKSDLGQLIFSARETPTESDELSAAQLALMTPAQRINHVRRQTK